METRVYGIELDSIGETNIKKLSDEEFKEMAESQGNVWSLKGFEADFNNDYLNQSNLFIKFVENEK